MDHTIDDPERCDGAVSLDTVDMAMQQLEQYRVPEKCGELMELLRAAVADVKMKDVMDTAERMIAELRS